MVGKTLCGVDTFGFFLFRGVVGGAMGGCVVCWWLQGQPEMKKLTARHAAEAAALHTADMTFTLDGFRSVSERGGGAWKAPAAANS